MSAAAGGTSPTATTVADLLDRANHVTQELLQSHDRVSLHQWESFDQTLYQLLSELIGARRVGPGPVDRAALPLYDIVKSYPTPLMPARPIAAEFSPTEAARLVGVTDRTIRKSILRGDLAATRGDTGALIPAESLKLRDDVTPADAGDPHPLSRLAVTLGALTDVVHTHQQDPDKPALDTGPVNRLAHDVLTIAAQAAHRTLTLIDLAHIQRPLAVARHAESALERLAPVATPHALPYAAVPPPSEATSGGVLPSTATAASLPGQLDRALAQWNRAARAEQALSVPSIDVIRNITSHAIHIYAAIDALLTPRPESGSAQADPNAPVRADLRAAARTLQRASDAWGQGTTGTRPTRDYVKAAQQLHDVLEAVIDNARDARFALERERVLDSLTAACPAVTSLLRQHASIARRLIDAGALLGPAKALKPSADRLHAVAAGRYVPIRYSDVSNLNDLAVASESAAQHIVRDVVSLPGAAPAPTRHGPVAEPRL